MLQEAYIIKDAKGFIARIFKDEYFLSSFDIDRAEKEAKRIKVAKHLNKIFENDDIPKKQKPKKESVKREKKVEYQYDHIELTTYKKEKKVTHKTNFKNQEDQERYDKNDHIAKIIASDFLQSTKEFILDTPICKQTELFSVGDFIIRRLADNKEVLVEVERRNVWIKSKEWQGWENLHIHQRKWKNKSDLFIVVNKKLDALVITDMQKAIKNPMERVYFGNGKTGLFFCVPLKDIILFVKNRKGCWVKQGNPQI